MRKTLLLSPCRRWLLAVGFLGSSPWWFTCQGLHAQVTGTATANATVQPAGPRPGTNGVNNFNVEGTANGTGGSLASFGVVDFPASAFALGGQQVSGAQNNTLTFTLTESDAAFTLPGTLAFYLTTNTTVSISNAAGASPLRFNTATATADFDPPYGVDTQLGTLAGGTLFSLGTGTFTSTGNINTGQKDVYTLTLNAMASAYFASALNATAGDLRLVIAPTSTTTAATFFGVGNATAANRPQLAFTPTFATANNLYWQGGTGTWTPTGGTQWNPANASPGTTGWDNGGTAVAAFSSTPGSTVTANGAINAAGLRFDVNGYTVATAAGSAVTLSAANSFIQVTNATDTATISAPLAGTTGYNKTGAGTLVLSGTNTFTGNTTLTGGVLSISAAANLGANGNGVVFNGGTLTVANTLTSLGGGRAVTGSTGNLVYSGTTPLVLNGDVTLTGALGLQGTGSVTLGDASGRGFDTIGGISTANPITLTSTGVLNTSGITAFQASGTTVINGNVLFNTSTTNVNVANAGATLQITGAVGTGSVTAANGFTQGSGVLVKQGAGTLDLLGDNSALTAATATSGAVRQGVAGTTPAAGGTIMVHTATGLGAGQYQFNSGTFVNASGGMLTFANTLSIGGGQLAGGAVFGGTAGASNVFTGNLSLFNPTGSVYQHVITVNAPTTFTGIFSSPTAGTNSGLLLAGTSSLTLAPAGGPNTFTEDITVSGGTTLTLATTGALGANRSLSLLSNALLTFTLGTGVQDAINDGAFVSLAANSLVTLGGDNETVGGLSLNGVTQPAGTYGAPNSGAVNTSAFFTGAGILTNLGTTAPIPEPSTWAAVLAGVAGLLAARGRRRTEATVRARPI